jgi:hypothetical protein
VSRLNASGIAWEEVVGGAGPINHADHRAAVEPSLTAIGGVPYVAWRELDGTNYEVRASRLEPEFRSQSAVASATGATLSAAVHTYGIRYPIGFEYGLALASRTTAEPAPAGSNDVTVTRQVSGLKPATGYAFRPFATAGVPAPRVVGAIDAFTTLAATPGSGAAVLRGFGKKTGVTLRLAAGRFPAKGPIAVRVANANDFVVTGRLSGEASSRARRLALAARSFRVGARGHKAVKLALPKALRRQFQRKHRLSLRLSARVTDPRGHARVVHATVRPALRLRRRA